MQCLGIEGGGGGTFWVCNVEGREAHIRCWAVGLRETKPINFGSHKAERNDTNTVLGY